MGSLEHVPSRFLLRVPIAHSLLQVSIAQFQNFPSEGGDRGRRQAQPPISWHTTTRCADCRIDGISTCCMYFSIAPGFNFSADSKD